MFLAQNLGRYDNGKISFRPDPIYKCILEVVNGNLDGMYLRRERNDKGRIFVAKVNLLLTHMDWRDFVMQEKYRTLFDFSYCMSLY